MRGATERAEYDAQRARTRGLIEANYPGTFPDHAAAPDADAEWFAADVADNSEHGAADQELIQEHVR